MSNPIKLPIVVRKAMQAYYDAQALGFPQEHTKAHCLEVLETECKRFKIGFIAAAGTFWLGWKVNGRVITTTHNKTNYWRCKHANPKSQILKRLEER